MWIVDGCKTFSDIFSDYEQQCLFHVYTYSLYGEGVFVERWPKVFDWDVFIRNAPYLKNPPPAIENNL